MCSKLALEYVTPVLKQAKLPIFVRRVCVEELWDANWCKRNWQNVVTLSSKFKAEFGSHFHEATGMSMKEAAAKYPQWIQFASGSIWNKILFGEPNHIPQGRDRVSFANVAGNP